MATLTLTNHLRLLDQVLEFLTNFKPDDPPVISDGEILFPKILAYDINKDFLSYIYTGDSNEEIFLHSLNITFEGSIKMERNTRNQSDCSLWFELHKPRITSSICQRIFLCQRNSDTLCTESINLSGFEDLQAKIKEALNHGKKFESGARELYIDITRLKLRQYFLLLETTIIFMIFWNFLMFHQIFLSPQVKWWAIITDKHGIYNLPHELANDLRHRILENYEMSEKCLNFIEW